jgi:hypothetical protein
VPIKNVKGKRLETYGVSCNSTKPKY